MSSTQEILKRIIKDTQAAKCIILAKYNTGWIGNPALIDRTQMSLADLITLEQIQSSQLLDLIEGSAA